MVYARQRVRPHAPRIKRQYQATSFEALTDWESHPDIDAYIPWLQSGGVGDPPPLLRSATLRFRRPDEPRQYGHVMVLGGGGRGLTEYAPPVLLNTLDLPTHIISSSAGTFGAHAILTARCGADLVRSLAEINGVPYREILSTKDRKFGMPQASAQLLTEWDLARTNGARFGDVRLAHVPPGMEGWNYAHQVTVSVGFVHRDKAKYLVGARNLKPGETAEVSLWDALFAAFLKRGPKTYMTQYIFPRDMFSLDPKNPGGIGPMAHHLRAMIGSEKIEDVRRWVDQQYISTWNAHSSRNPLAIKALAVGLPDGHVMIVGDGQMLGPPPLLREGEPAPANIYAAQTQAVDLRRRYRNREIREIDVSPIRGNSLKFESHTDDIACEMSRRGAIEAFRRGPELRWEFNQPWVRSAPPDPAYMPLSERARETMFPTVYYNLRGLSSALRDHVSESRHEIEVKGMQLLGSILAREGLSIFDRHRDARGLDLDLASSAV